MANPKKRRKILIFSAIFLVIAALAAVALLRKREVIITVQTEKVARRNITEIVPANGKIQPVLQVKISAEVSGEIIELPVKEGQFVNKGDLLVKIKPEFYVAQLHQTEAGYESALANKSQAEANLRKAQAEFKRSDDLFRHHLISDSTFDEVKAAFDVAKAQVEGAAHQVEMSKASVDSAKDALEKTIIVSPLPGTISKLNSRLGERVLGTVQNVGTEIMTISDLTEMETRIDVGENDVVRIAPGQKAKLEVDAFKNRKFNGIVTEIANSSNDTGLSSGSGNQEATKFQVRIRIQEKEAFRPGMSVTAEIETSYRTNVLTVPFASVTSRPPKDKDKDKNKDKKTDSKLAAAEASPGTNSSVAKTNPSTGKSPAGNPRTFVSLTNSPPSASTNTVAASTNTSSSSTNDFSSDKKSKEAPKPIEVVFVMEGDHAKMIPVKIGVSDDNYWEITEGLTEGQEIVSGGYKAINRELEDGKKVRKGTPPKEDEEKKS
jgi:HlyD family secretion protein